IQCCFIQPIFLFFNCGIRQKNATGNHTKVFKVLFPLLKSTRSIFSHISVYLFEFFSVFLHLSYFSNACESI
ncbi:hypothetical protein AOA57_00335, partial [Pseudomonas sp. 2588-5]